MDMAHFFDRIQVDLQLHREAYKFYVEVALVAVLFYVGLTDFQTFKIQNNVVLLLVVLYVLFAFVARAPSEILSNLVLAAIMFAVLLWLFSRGVIGGGDVKFVTAACLWIGLHCALLFSIILFPLISLHVLAAWMGWATTKPMAGRLAIPYAPSVAGALIALVLLGCL
jgi:Flp pilus assembly protein protease CpaA